MKILALILVFALVSCAAPETKIETKPVSIAVPVRCEPKTGERPMLQTKEVVAKALAAAPTFDDRLKIVTEQLLLYMGWTPKVEAALAGCVGVPIP